MAYLSEGIIIRIFENINQETGIENCGFQNSILSPRDQWVNYEFPKASHNDMETLFALLVLCEGNPLVTSGFPWQRTSNLSFKFSSMLAGIKNWTMCPVASDLGHPDVLCDVCVKLTWMPVGSLVAEVWGGWAPSPSCRKGWGSHYGNVLWIPRVSKYADAGAGPGGPSRSCQWRYHTDRSRRDHEAWGGSARWTGTSGGTTAVSDTHTPGTGWTPVTPPCCRQPPGNHSDPWTCDQRITTRAQSAPVMIMQNIINSLGPGRNGNDFKTVIFKLTSSIWFFSNLYEIDLRRKPLDPTDDKSTMGLVMAWCRQAASHYLNQCWHRSMSPYRITRPQWVK